MPPPVSRSSAAIHSEAADQPTDSAWYAFTPATRRWAFCVFLHVLLVLLHLVAVMAADARWESRVTWDLNGFTAAWLPLLLSSGIRIFAMLYLTFCVNRTQRLMVQRDMYLQQELTDLHDKTHAWNGLWSALEACWWKLKKKESMSSVSVITLYISMMIVLHVTIPGTLQVVTYLDTDTVSRNITLANASYVPDLLIPYDILSVYNQFPTKGLTGNMVYDVIPLVPNATATTEVNAAIYEVDCGVLPDLQLVAPNACSDSGSSITNGQTNLLFTATNETCNDMYITLPAPYYPSVYTGRLTTGCSIPYLPDAMYSMQSMPIIVASTIPILDSLGNRSATSDGAPSIQITPQYLEVSIFEQQESVIMTGLQVLACNVQINDTKINVSSVTGEPVDPQGPARNATWKTWTPLGNVAVDGRLAGAQAASLKSPPSYRAVSLMPGGTTQVYPVLTNVSFDAESPSMLFPDHDSANSQYYHGVNDSTVKVLPLQFDTFLTADLGLVTTYAADLRNMTISLQDLNFSIGKALAAIYWYGRNVNYSDPHLVMSVGVCSAGSVKVETESSEALIPTTVVRQRLEISWMMALIGLSASTVLCFLLEGLIAWNHQGYLKEDEALTPGTMGVLQVSCLVRGEDEALRVRNMDIDTLRAAGRDVLVLMMDVIRKNGEQDADGQKAKKTCVNGRWL
ncbi:hypothetical protein PsYK624_063430 [Phanerochaete sordida]|uniref:Uncharacterized protein n=1 Tax=Phanerochaete sordida TaxID=48140 RepID=A0A9P3G8F7_9APHY|nr:hypothetical protein PsYK624_063430 [Phanerochaete sordida]